MIRRTILAPGAQAGSVLALVTLLACSSSGGSTGPFENAFGNHDSGTPDTGGASDDATGAAGADGSSASDSSGSSGSGSGNGSTETLGEGGVVLGADGGPVLGADGGPIVAEGIGDGGVVLGADGGPILGADGGRIVVAIDASTGTGPSGDGGAPDATVTGPLPSAACSRTGVWANPVLVAASTASDDRLDSVTPDELSIAWTVQAGSARTLYYADRASTSVAFGTPQTLDASPYANDRVALSPDGLRLVVVDGDAQGFTELTRASRGASSNTFGSASAGSYTNFAGVLPAGESFGDPVVGADDVFFYYSVYGGGLTNTVYRTTRLRPGESWPLGAYVGSSGGLSAQGSLRRHPTGVSADGQTLFITDDVDSTERAAWINTSSGAFDFFVDLGARSLAVPNGSCTRLYYSSPGTSSVDLFVAAD